MDRTDACIYPYPLGDSSVQRMALEAGELGFDSLVALGNGSAAPDGIRVLQGVLIQEKTVKAVIGQVRRAGSKAEVILVDAGELAFNRGVLSVRGIHVLRQIHRTPRKAFDHIAARMAAERLVAVDIDLQPLIQSRGGERQRALRRYADILRLQRHFRFPLTLSSSARSILDLRSPREFAALCALFGMQETEVHAALSTVGRLLAPRGSVQVVE